MAYRDQTIHKESKVPRLYREMIQEYIYQSLRERNFSNHNPTALGEMLYEKIDYPGIETDKTKISFLTLSGNEDLIPSNPHSLVDNKDLWIKYPRGYDLQAQERATTELYIGMIMNKLCRKVPNFALTIGAFKCQTQTDEKSAPAKSSSHTPNEPAILHLVQERVNGPTLDTWIRKNFNPHQFVGIILQISFALAKAQEKRGFVHGGLYASNIILRPSNFSTTTYQLGAFDYEILTGNMVPIIIDYSSSRVAHHGFGISYSSNPTIFNPGKDLCKLITSCLALINRNKRAWNSTHWLGDFFNHYYNVEHGDYSDLIKHYDGFDLPEDHPMASLSAMDFVSWFRSRKGELFNSLVKIRSRRIKPFPANSEKFDPVYLKQRFKLDTDEQNSPLKQLIQDPELPASYRGYLEAHPVHLYAVNYNFPIDHQYDRGKRIDYKSILSELERGYKILSDYITLLRIKTTVNSKFVPSPTPVGSLTIWETKELLRHNMMIIRNLPLYRLYRLAQAGTISNEQDGQISVLVKEYPKLSNWTKIMFPVIAKNFNNSWPSFIRNLAVSDDLYFPPCSLLQFETLRKHNMALGGTQGLDDMEIILSGRYQEALFNLPKSADQIAEHISPLIRRIIPGTIQSYLNIGNPRYNIGTKIIDQLKLNRKHYSSLDYDILRNTHIDDITETKMFNLISVINILHSFPNISDVLRLLRKSCDGFLVITEHDCRTDADRMKLDLYYSLIEKQFLSGKNDYENRLAKYLNDAQSNYRSYKEWIDLVLGYGFRLLYAEKTDGLTREFIAVFSVASK